MTAPPGCGRPATCSPISLLVLLLRKKFAGLWDRSEEHTSELQSQSNLVCRLLLEKKKPNNHPDRHPLRHVLLVLKALQAACVDRHQVTTPWLHDGDDPSHAPRHLLAQHPGRSMQP